LIQLIYLNPTDTFNIQLKMGLIIGIFIACPILLYQVWASSRRHCTAMKNVSFCHFLFLSVILFLCGGYFGYQGRVSCSHGLFNRQWW